MPPTVLAATVLAAIAAAQRWMDDDHMDGWGWVMMAIVLLLVVVVVVGLVLFISRDAKPRDRGPDPIDVLDHRFARGEIDEDEYRKRRDILRG